jgi:hypothetical protein
MDTVATHPQEIHRDKRKDGGFFSNFNNLVDCHMKDITGLQMKIMSAVLRHADATGETWVSDETIAEKAGTGARHVQRAISGVEANEHRPAQIGLIEKGLLQRRGNGGRGKRRTLIVSIPKTTAELADVSNTETTADLAGVSHPETPAEKAVNPGRKVHKTPAKSAIPVYSSEQTNNSTNNSKENIAVAAGDSSKGELEGKEGVNQELISAFDALGIIEPTRSTLVEEIPELTSSILYEISLITRSGPHCLNRAGVLVKAIRANARRMIADEKRQKILETESAESPPDALPKNNTPLPTVVFHNACPPPTVDPQQAAAKARRELERAESAAKAKAESEAQAAAVAEREKTSANADAKFREKFSDAEWGAMVEKYYRQWPATRQLSSNPNFNIVRDIRGAVDSGRMSPPPTAVTTAGAA